MIKETDSGALVTAPVNRILRSSIVDGPGNRAAVFLQGCNFNCVYCHNPETIALCSSCGGCVPACPVGALRGGSGKLVWEREKCILCDACLKACRFNSSPRVRRMTPREVMAEIEPSLPFIRGITVSGGECTLYPEFLRGLGALARERGLSFFLDSNGTYDFSGDGELLALTGGVMLDIKADPDDPSLHERVTGGSGYDILGLAEFLAEKGKLRELRTVVSPGLFDAAFLVDKVCRRVANAASRAAGAGGFRYKLIKYRPVGVRPEAAEKLAVPDDAFMEELARICAKYGARTVIV